MSKITTPIDTVISERRALLLQIRVGQKCDELNEKINLLTQQIDKVFWGFNPKKK